MSAKSENAAIVGVGVAACAVCCAGPILGVLAAIGVTTAVGFAALGLVALLVGALAVALVVVRRRRRVAACDAQPLPLTSVPIELGETRSRS